MTSWSPEIPDHGARYLAIAEALNRDVHSGRLQPGERLPTHRHLARALGVNVVTVTRAYNEAARRGLVEGEVGRGTFVRRTGPIEQSLQPLSADDNGLVDFHFNLPFGKPGDLNLKAVFTELAKDADPYQLLSGYSLVGVESHRVAGAQWMARTFPGANAERTLVCGGAQHGMALSFASLTSPGDLVLTEELTYPGMKALAAMLNLRLQGLAMDRDGVLPDAFENACKKSFPKALYCMPNVHNPTGVVMPESRRREIAAIARTYGVALVEDDTYSYLLAEAPPALSSFAPEISYFLSSLSKSVASGLRIAYILAPDAGGSSNPPMQRLAAKVPAIAWMAAPLMGEIASRWIHGGEAMAMVKEKRKETAARRKLYEEILASHPTASHPRSSHVWLNLPAPWRGEDFVQQARRNGVALSSSEAFIVGRNRSHHSVRVCMCTPGERSAAKTGLKIIADTLQMAPEFGMSLV